jgi:quinol monooxygenase YgiN
LVLPVHDSRRYITEAIIETTAMIVIHATFPVAPDERERAVEQMQELAEHSRDEDGVITYEVVTDIDDPNVFRVMERYEDEAAFGAHSQTDHLGEFAELLPELLAGEPEIMRFDVESASEVQF